MRQAGAKWRLPCVATDASMRRQRRLHAPARDSTCLAGACAVSRERQSWRASRPRGRPARADHRRACRGERPRRRGINLLLALILHHPSRFRVRIRARAGARGGAVARCRRTDCARLSRASRTIATAGWSMVERSPERRASEGIPRLPSPASHRRHARPLFQSLSSASSAP
jgi:hypothetical protein